MKVEDFYIALKNYGIDCFCGVPDSLLKDFCAYLTDNVPLKEHTITANEGNAVALAAGHYLATGNPAVVYMQNSGLGNCINPLLSLTDEDVYNIPLLMLVGWRGEPGTKDEPQHIKQGMVTEKLLNVTGVKYEILPDNFEKAEPLIKNAFIYMKETNKPFAFLIRKGTFDKYVLQSEIDNGYALTREEAIETVIKNLTDKDVIVSTTGYTSREVYEVRERLGQSHNHDFLTVGSMGHASSIALGIALDKSDRNIYCFDGDGAFLMHQGALAVNASKHLTNFKHIVFNNEAHDSVGAQPTAACGVNMTQVANAAGYQRCYTVSSKEELEKILPVFAVDNVTAFLEIKVKCGARKNLGRPKELPSVNKEIFMENLNQITYCYPGAIEKLQGILLNENAKKILVFTGKKAFEKIKTNFQPRITDYETVYYNNFSNNPKKDEVDIAIKELSSDFDIIIAIGGGSVIDFAKAYRHYSKLNTKLIAIPTTCGTGSEATQFAVIYVDGVKHSLDNRDILPEYAIIDSIFVENVPKEIRLSSALDTFCQAIESYWAVKSNLQSREFARQALVLCRDYMTAYINNPDSFNSAQMCMAANYSGKAINISRTTAAHAMSYPITTYYGIPHGMAVALTINQLCKVNSNVSEKNCQDPRGAAFVQSKIDEVKNILGIDNFDKYFSELFEKINFDVNRDFDIDKISGQVNLERLANNPAKLSQSDISNIIRRIGDIKNEKN